ncbi:VOC family protein [Erythrobacter sp. F6033]|uniref:VOC family protein n=1 Tax=Erythrobacter sp. F6033 TaxID=2926401 RepID=UPI001FF35FF2|nr:glyoxalase [Erythrobacter sp. F6033]
MGVIGLDHVQLAIPAGGEDQMRGFFCGLLGMVEVPKPANLSPSGLWLTGGGAHLHIGVDPDFTPARKAHPAFLVDDLSLVQERLETAGYETRDDKPVDGYARFFTTDPFGNRIELMQRL